MKFDTLLYQTEGGIAFITINRPDKLNALNARVMEELKSAVAEAGADTYVRAIIITGSGEKAFVAGADISQFLNLTYETGKAFALAGQELFLMIENSSKPVIAAINGFALGGGSELALACHIRICSENAKFGQPEVNLGLIPGYGGTQRLPRIVGKGRAMELILSGDIINAAEALRIGLVNRVVPLADLLAAAKELALKIIAKAPRAVGHAIEAVNAFGELPQKEGLALEADLFGTCCSTEDAKEGAKAFLEKRKPDFTGR